jgi:hypothetical protein
VHGVIAEPVYVSCAVGQVIDVVEAALFTVNVPATDELVV